MSRNTEIIVSSAKRPPDPKRAIAEILALTGATEVHGALRTVGESHEYAVRTAFIRGESDLEEDDYVNLGSRLKLQRAPNLYHEGTCLTLDVGFNPLVRALKHELRPKIAPEDIADYYLNGIFLDVGAHDLFEELDEEPTFLGRFFLSVRFWGYGTPADPTLLLETFVGLEEFRRFRQRFEALFGPSEISYVTIL